MSEIVVLRLAHRLPRDERTTTHVALVARAFGADEFVYTGQKDSGLDSSVSSLVSNWGGDFTIKHEQSHRKFIKKLKKDRYIVVHLTMYGLPISEQLQKLNTENRKFLIVVGGEAVPAEIFELADFNIAVTSQPHSEVAALAIILDRLQNGKELEREFNDHFKGKLKIEPSEKGKQFLQSE